MPSRSKLVSVCVWIGTSLSVLLIAAMPLSYHWTLIWTANNSRTRVFTVPGGLHIERLRFFIYGERWTEPGWTFWSDIPWRCYGHRGWRAGAYAQAIIVPFWLILLPVATPTAILAWRNRRRRRTGYCTQCDYNLTGNVTGHCPECGSEVADATDNQHVTTAK